MPDCWLHSREYREHQSKLFRKWKALSKNYLAVNCKEHLSLIVEHRLRSVIRSTVGERYKIKTKSTLVPLNSPGHVSYLVCASLICSVFPAYSPPTGSISEAERHACLILLILYFFFIISPWSLSFYCSSSVLLFVCFKCVCVMLCVV